MLRSKEKIRFNIKGGMQSDVGWAGLWARAIIRSRGSCDLWCSRAWKFIHQSATSLVQSSWFSVDQLWKDSRYGGEESEEGDWLAGGRRRKLASTSSCRRHKQLQQHKEFIQSHQLAADIDKPRSCGHVKLFNVLFPNYTNLSRVYENKETKNVPRHRLYTFLVRRARNL